MTFSFFPFLFSPQANNRARVIVPDGRNHV
jgi:hypothetical protein